MKSRSSLNKAKWSLSREEDYKRLCEQILFKKREEIIISDGAAYLKSNDKKELFLKIEDEKTAWYRIWCKLKYNW